MVAIIFSPTVRSKTNYCSLSKEESTHSKLFQIDFNQKYLFNPLKAYFSKKKYFITIQTPLTQIVISIFNTEKPVFNGFLNII